jgi:acyl carrier protein
VKTEVRTMTRDDLRAVALDALKQVAPEADLSALDPARNFRDQLEIDSVDYLNFVLALEQRLGIQVPELHYPRLSSLNGCVAYLASALAAGGE